MRLRFGISDCDDEPLRMHIQAIHFSTRLQLNGRQFWRISASEDRRAISFRARISEEWTRQSPIVPRIWLCCGTTDPKGR